MRKRPRTPETLNKKPQMTIPTFALFDTPRKGKTFQGQSILIKNRSFWAEGKEAAEENSFHNINMQSIGIATGPHAATA